LKASSSCSGDSELMVDVGQSRNVKGRLSRRGFCQSGSAAKPYACPQYRNVAGDVAGDVRGDVSGEGRLGDVGESNPDPEILKPYLSGKLL
jgi:hypothetical protein